MNLFARLIICTAVAVFCAAAHAQSPLDVTPAAGLGGLLTNSVKDWLPTIELALILAIVAGVAVMVRSILAKLHPIVDSFIAQAKLTPGGLDDVIGKLMALLLSGAEGAVDVAEKVAGDQLRTRVMPPAPGPGPRR